MHASTQSEQTAYHFIGIGGIGMSGLAHMLLKQGKAVSGSDRAKSMLTDTLEKHGARIFVGQKKEHVKANSTIIYSTDISEDNPEFARAKELGCPIWHRSDLLKHLMTPYMPLLVSGTHGKTTTSALLTHVFTICQMRPSFAVGGVLSGMEKNASLQEGAYFIAEADESDKTFLKYPAKAAIVTNIDSDHLAHYGSWQALVDAFKTFMCKVQDPNLLFYSADCAHCMALKVDGISYGFSDEADLRIVNFRQNGFGIVYDVFFQGRRFTDIAVSLTGRHNALNSASVFALALQLGLDETLIRQALKNFCGVKRRMEKKGDLFQAEIFDDYAHHPTELRATLKALRLAVSSRRIIAIYQPHRYSRMRYLLDQFKHAFDDADLVFITDIYTAGEAPVVNVSSDDIFHAILQHHQDKAHFIQRQDIVETIKAHIKPGDVVITLGAGDISKVYQELCQKS